MDTTVDVQKARRYAFNLLRMKSRSSSELTAKLKQKGFSEDTVTKTLSFLEKEGLADDLKFARSWVDYRMRTNPKSVLALKRELFAKGIPGEIIEEALKGERGNEATVVRRLAEEKIKQLRVLPWPKVRKKVFDYLTRRGFDCDVIEDTLRGVLEQGLYKKRS